MVDVGTCDLFINSCDKKYSTEDLIRMVIGADADGCPYVKTKPAAKVVGMAVEVFENTTMAALKADINTFLGANQDYILVSCSLSFDSQNNRHTALIVFDNV
jgi:hypothetical protein